MRIAVLGTFDLENYGDLLFPLLAERELTRRLGTLEILPFSYRSRQITDWPYEVHSIESFPSRLAEIDAVVMGGGHLIRFDTEVASGYGPPSDRMHHPTGLWLVPSFLAAAAGRPVIWNGVGASPDFEPWAIKLFRSTIESSAYVSARDRASRATLAALTNRVEVTIVPDSAFGIGELLKEEHIEESYAGWREAHRVHGPYVVVQCSPKLEPVMNDLRAQLDELTARDIAIVEAPIGPVLGDSTGQILPGREDVVRLDRWPHPLLLAKIIANAEATVGVSLHLGITSLCHGVPVHRPRCWPGLKYEILGEFPAVYQFDENGHEPRVDLRGKLGRREVGAGVRDQQERVAAHWDRVAEAVRRPVTTGFEAVGRFFFALPFDLIEAELARRHVQPAAEDPST